MKVVRQAATHTGNDLVVGIAVQAAAAGAGAGIGIARTRVGLRLLAGAARALLTAANGFGNIGVEILGGLFRSR